MNLLGAVCRATGHKKSNGSPMSKLYRLAKELTTFILKIHNTCWENRRKNRKIFNGANLNFSNKSVQKHALLYLTLLLSTI